MFQHGSYQARPRQSQSWIERISESICSLIFSGASRQWWYGHGAVHQHGNILKLFNLYSQSDPVMSRSEERTAACPI